MKGKAPRGHLERIICNPFVWSGLKTLQGITISSLGSRPTFTSFIEFFFTLCRVSTYCLFSYHSGFPSNWELAEGLSPFQWPGHNSGCHYKVTWELLKTPHVRASDKFIRVSEKWDLGMAFFKSSKSSNVQPGLRINKRHIALGWYFPTLDKWVLNVKTGSLFLKNSQGLSNG